MGVKLFAEDSIGETEFEIDKEKFLGRCEQNIPQAIKASGGFSNIIKEVIEPVIGIRKTVKVKSEEEQMLDLIISVSEEKKEVIRRIQELSNENEVTNLYNLAKARSDEEIKYLGINGEKIEVYQKMLGHLLLQGDINYSFKKYDDKYFIGDLWKFGISGDYPILLIEIRNIEDLYVIDEALESLEFFKTRNTRIDLCILNNEEMSYEQLLKDGIYDAIKNHQMEYLYNYQIFILNQKEMTESDIRTIRDKAKLIFEAKNGGLKVNLEELEEREKVKIPKEKVKIKTDFPITDEQENKLINMEELKYYNGFGGFSENGREYIIEVTKNRKTPRPWANIISNQEFGTVVTENFGGYTWYKNSRLQRITKWTNNAISDTPSEMIFIKNNENNKIWSVGNRLKTNQNYYVTHGMGYSIYKQLEDEILQEVTVFIPINSKTKINKINLKNLSRKKKKINLYYSVQLTLGEDETKTIGNIVTRKIDNKVICRNLCEDDFSEEVIITSNKPIKDYTNSKIEFLDGDITNPSGIYKEKWNTKDEISNGNMVSISFEIEIDAFDEEEVIITLGVDNEEYIDKEKVSNELDIVNNYWYEKTNKLKVKTPSEEINILLNSWIIYQTIVSRLFARSGLYQSGGAIGFRDQLQDCFGMKFIDVELLKNQIRKCARHQFKDGDVLHWWHETTERGIRTRFSDDLLWLPYAIIEYVKFTGDYEFINEEIPYLEGEKLKENEDERYDLYKQSDKKESIFMHAIRAIEKSINFGEHGLPKIGSGDWNDGFSTVGNKGKGESVWLGFFLYDILNRFEDILKYKNEEEYLKRYELIKMELKKTLNKEGWDGLWFRRAFTDNDEILGSIESPECKIDSITQSWAVISDAADNDKKYHSINSLENYLIDTQTGIIKLLTPAFSKSNLEPGYIKAYPEGVRENGGQYTHECCC